MLEDPTINSYESLYSNKYHFEWKPLSPKELKSICHVKLGYLFIHLINVLSDAISVKLWYVDVIILPATPRSKASSISRSINKSPAFLIKLTDNEKVLHLLNDSLILSKKVLSV